MKQVAVLSSNLEASLVWLKDQFKCKRFLATSRIFISEDDTRYFIVSISEHIKGMEFDNYIKAPDYYSLEDDLKSRIRNREKYHE